jgi:hypothetical protein
MYPVNNALKKSLNAEGTHLNISSIPSWLFDLIFIETNDAYRNRLRQIILEKIQKKLEQSSSIAQTIQKNTFHLDISGIDYSTSCKSSSVSLYAPASEKSSKPDEGIL